VKVKKLLKKANECAVNDTCFALSVFILLSSAAFCLLAAAAVMRG